MKDLRAYLSKKFFRRHKGNFEKSWTVASGLPCF